tara:strand:+ start:129 stop:731 length:603 start_codon:yes stop_codon:yes gene_type:complete
MQYLHSNNIIYRRDPISDQPTEVYEWGCFYKEGTHQCYELFRSKAQITTYKSLKWHLLVLWYLNPQLNPDKFEELAYIIANKSNGFATFDMPEQLLKQMIYEISMMDLEQPPKNKIRKVIFKDFTGLTKSEKLSIVGKLIGRSSKATPEDIYETMLLLHDDDKKITVAAIAKVLGVSTRTVYRNMTHELTKEKELLNEKI